jgi:hypothetical protein
MVSHNYHFPVFIVFVFHPLQKQCIEVSLYYFSDGASAQYKNKSNFINLCHHNTDFGINDEEHFFATSYGKGPCDGVGGTIKCLAACFSLQHHQILNPAQLYSQAKDPLAIHACTICLQQRS